MGKNKYAARYPNRGRRAENYSNYGKKSGAKQKVKFLKRIILIFVLLALVALGIYCALNFKGIYRTFVKSTAAPKKFIVKEISDNRVEMTWSRVKDASGYRLYSYDGTAKKYKKLADLPGDTDTYTVGYSGSDKYAVKTYKTVWFWEDKSDYKTTASVEKINDQIEIIGHRGDMEVAPENTLASFKAAHDNGYAAFETDYWQTDNGDLLISHEKDLSVHLGIEGSIKSLDYSTRLLYPIVNGVNIGKYKTQYIPTLEEAVKAASDYKMKLYLHTKNSSITDFTVTEVLRILDKYNMRDKTIVFTSNIECLDTLKRFDCPSGYLKIPSMHTDIYDAIDLAREHGAEIVICKYSEEYMSEALVDIAHKSNMKIGCYDVNDKETAFKMVELGADFLVTNKRFFA